MALTIILSLAGCALLFFGIWGVTVTMPTKLLAKNFPEDVQERLKPRLEEWEHRGMSLRRFLGWIIMVPSIGGLYHRYPAGRVKHSLRDFSPEAGFEYRIPDTGNPAVARFDIVSCPYHTMCEKYSCLELNPAFCDSDDAKYGHLHKNLKWARTGTIGKGAACCDFRIIDIERCPDYQG